MTEGSKGSKARGYLWIIIGIALIVGLAVNHFSPTPPSPPVATAAPAAAAPRDPAQEKQDAEISTAAAGAETIQQNLRNPDSFKLVSAVIMPSGAVCYEYRAQNGFGGMNVEDAYLKGANVHIQGSPDFNGGWNRYCAGKSGRDFTYHVTTILMYEAKLRQP